MSQPQGGNPAGGVVGRFLGPLREVLQQLDPPGRVAVNRFWGEVRRVIRGQEDEIQDLRRRLAQSTASRVLLPRPDTSNSVNDVRAAIDNELQVLAQYAPDASTTIETLVDIPMLWARDYLTRIRRPNRSGELDCWVSDNAPSHDTGYVKVNLRNTPWPAGSNKQGYMNVQPYVHQLAMVGKGEGDRLRLTTKGEYNVSHLCHNPACFNPSHLLIEWDWLNKLRNSCKHSYILELPDKTVIDPCPHWKHGAGVHCILPRRILTGDMVGRYVDMGSDGPILRTGHH